MHLWLRKREKNQRHYATLHHCRHVCSELLETDAVSRLMHQNEKTLITTSISGALRRHMNTGTRNTTLENRRCIVERLVTQKQLPLPNHQDSSRISQITIFKGIGIRYKRRHLLGLNPPHLSDWDTALIPVWVHTFFCQISVS